MNVHTQKISAEMADFMIRTLSHLEKEISSNLDLHAPSLPVFSNYVEDLLKREIKYYTNYKKVLTAPKEPVFHVSKPKKVLNDLEFATKSIEIIRKKLNEKAYVTLSKKNGYQEQSTFLETEAVELEVEFNLIVKNMNRMKNPFSKKVEKKEEEMTYHMVNLDHLKEQEMTFQSVTPDQQESK